MQARRQKSRSLVTFTGVAAMSVAAFSACSGKPLRTEALRPEPIRAGGEPTSLPSQLAGADSSRESRAGSGFFSRLFGTDEGQFAESGSIVLSFQVPERSAEPQASNSLTGQPQKFAPLLGYFPPRLSKLPAANELWIEIDRTEKRLRVFEGKRAVEEVAVEGLNGLQSGQYLVHSKQSSPRWYATDDYFLRRGLPVPGALDDARYLRGALGAQALFLSEHFAIHSSPVWTPEVGGARVERTVLSRIFDQAPLGVSVFVR